jgi:glycosyltransferase EpsF
LIADAPRRESTNRIRLLHIVENLNDQAVESWLLRILSRARDSYPEVDWTFYCTLGIPGRGDERAIDLGAEVIQSPVALGETVSFVRELRRTIVRGRFDVMHAHHDIVSAVYLLASVATAVRQRIVHIHNTSMTLPTPAPLKRALVREPMRQICLHFADKRVGISRDALSSMLRERKPRPGRDVVVYYGIDTTRFDTAPNAVAALRRELADESSKVILFAGRMTDYKNPRFAVGVLRALSERGRDVVLAFAGVGPEEQAVKELAHVDGLSSRVRLLGWRDDLPQLMLASDMLIWPGREEPREGLGLGIVEAQAAGLPILMSRSVPEDAIEIEDLVTVMPLTEGPERWADAAERILSRARPDRYRCLAQIEDSRFSLEAGTRNIMELYDGVRPR